MRSDSDVDGGGIRGLSELYILDHLMIRLMHKQGRQEPPKPCDIFDMIAGTSTGG
jgi:patatin-like phospholipase/acyl hydrolase